MKPIHVLLAFLTITSLSASGQGKVTIQNDPGSAFTLGPVGQIMAPDAALAGQPVPTTDPLPSGSFLTVGLYAGTSASTLTLVNVLIPLNRVGGTGLAAGMITPTHAILPFEGGTLAYFQLKVWDSTLPDYEHAITAGEYAGEGAMFTMTPGLSSKLPYPAINNGGGTTWTEAPITFPLIPEPSTFTLAGLGITALLIFRRRK
jgi:hypothetical protein